MPVTNPTGNDILTALAVCVTNNTSATTSAVSDQELLDIINTIETYKTQLVIDKPTIKPLPTVKFLY